MAKDAAPSDPGGEEIPPAFPTEDAPPQLVTIVHTAATAPPRMRRIAVTRSAVFGNHMSTVAIARIGCLIFGTNGPSDIQNERVLTTAPYTTRAAL